ncbi:MAG: hypothetical protein BWY73_01284 [candidate division TA06 bacterium ADurb.Bin417]|uniref:Peptidase C45 hydrolase domain-containing protein n=1 Tax=candidate division TA06 bacterium ADurb.Bin417 TaxID=1852828 RepID=A0A1V5MBK7_UNCT6|nr:MAG: hypothetical protein BWY73_01284 [candidate division TA06 bacterium ADurb.Bin417]
MNEKGLAIGGASAPYGLTAGPGLGLYVGMRLALQTCATVAEAVELFAGHRPPSKGHCYGLVDRTGAGAVIETNHDRMAVRPLTDRYLVAPNRFHASGMIEFNASRGAKNEENCQLRERLLTAFLEAPGGRFDLNTAMDSLRLHDGKADGICRHAYTRFGIVGQPEAVRFFLGDGFPCQTDFKDVGRI